MAVATPTILPVPTRPDRATQNASNEEMPRLPAFLPKRERIISPKRRTWTKRVRNEKYSPAAISSTTSPGFQTIPLIWDTILSNMASER